MTRFGYLSEGVCENGCFPFPIILLASAVGTRSIVGVIFYSLSGVLHYRVPIYMWGIILGSIIFFLSPEHHYLVHYFFGSFVFALFVVFGSDPREEQVVKI